MFILLLYSKRSASAMGTPAACLDGMIVMTSEATKAKAEISAICDQGTAYDESDVGNSSEVTRKYESQTASTIPEAIPSAATNVDSSRKLRSTVLHTKP